MTNGIIVRIVDRKKNLENVKRVATEMENAKRDFEIVYSQQLRICSQNETLFEFFSITSAIEPGKER